MNWQQALSLVIVAFTAFLFIRSFIRKRNRSALGICENDCGCSASGLVKKIPTEKLKQLKDLQKQRAQPRTNH